MVKEQLPCFECWMPPACPVEPHARCYIGGASSSYSLPAPQRRRSRRWGAGSDVAAGVLCVAKKSKHPPGKPVALNWEVILWPVLKVEYRNARAKSTIVGKTKTGRTRIRNHSR